MRLIQKNSEPVELSNWKSKNPEKLYKDIDSGVAQEIRRACAKEQYFLCAYCCKEISGEHHDTLNEHLIPQSIDNTKTLDFSNIVASCTTKKQCDASKKANLLPITPLMPECEELLSFQINGEVKGLNKRAKQAISILNLNNPSLQKERKDLIDTTLGFDETGGILGEHDDNFLLLLCEKILIPDDNGKLSAYAPAVANAIKNWINK